MPMHRLQRSKSGHCVQRQWAWKYLSDKLIWQLSQKCTMGADATAGVVLEAIAARPALQI